MVILVLFAANRLIRFLQASLNQDLCFCVQIVKQGNGEINSQSYLPHSA